MQQPLVKAWLRSSTALEEILAASLVRSSTRQTVSLSPESLSDMEYYMLQTLRPVLRRQLEADAKIAPSASGDDPGRLLRTLTRGQAESATASPAFAEELERRRALAQFGLVVDSMANSPLPGSLLADPSFRPKHLPKGTLVIASDPSA